ncbi:MAG: lipopolysaccharide heptosyltransferase family protein [Hydrotalea sp. AMD]|uniref:glycosyltransferase family 9 protein n=1 Tax=Hydrotalea sp. AMD TaxID=2501297 RepID=UPI00094402E5|nr:glycosyltransferase family 9 protein [Hydrotalea sp. AMD]RWZ88332.1 MAG: lipopolysaccharide heptosyltransferase family protein [Hydrotalea sp. AMD]
MIQNIVIKIAIFIFYIIGKTQSLSLKKRNINLNKATFLVCRLDHIGDVVMTTPAFRSIKEAYLGSKVFLLTNSSSRSLIDNNPFIDELIYFNWPWPYDKRNNYWTLKNLLKCIKTIKYIRSKHIDCFIEFRGDPRFVFLFGILANIPLRISSLRKGGKSLLTYGVSFNEDEHQVDVVAKILNLIDVKIANKRPEIFLNDIDRKNIKEILNSEQLPFDSLYAVISPFSAHSVREWPFYNWNIIAEFLKTKFDMFSIIVGTKEDYDIAASDIANNKEYIFNLCGKTSLRNVAALMENARIVIGVDTGTQHIASCFDVPLITIFGPAKPQQTRPITPYGIYIDNNYCVCDRSKRIMCNHPENGYSKCLIETSTEQVCVAISNILLNG